MTVATYDFENGTDGALLTDALTGGHVYGSNGHFSAAGAMHGSLGCVYASGDLYHRVEWTFGATSMQVAVRVYVKTDGIGSAIPTLLQLLDASGTVMGSIAYNAGLSYCYGSDSTNATIGGTHVTFPTADSWYRLDMVADAAAGSGSFSVSAGDDETSIGTLTAASGLNFGTGPFAKVNVGLAAASGLTAGSVYFDDVAWSPGATSEIGPATVTPPATGPTVRGVIIGGVEVPVTLRGVIQSGTEVPVSVLSVVGSSGGGTGDGAALPASLPFTL